MVDHEVILRGLTLNGSSHGSPTILERSDQTFIPAILDELIQEDGLAKVASSEAATRVDVTVNSGASESTLKLFQPVHRTFHVAMFEVACDTFGEPRFDPGQIVSSGLVVRRVAVNESAAERQSGDELVMEGWLSAGNQIEGWLALESERERNQDPDPTLRRPVISTGNPEIDRQLWQQQLPHESFGESVSPLFVAPPEVCQATGKTILYGLVPVTSEEFGKGLPQLPQPDAGIMKDFFSSTLSTGVFASFLNSAGGHPFSLPLQDNAFNFAAESGLSQAEKEYRGLFVKMLRYLFEFGYLDGTPEAKALHEEFNRIKLGTNLSFFNMPAGELIRNSMQRMLALEEQQATGSITLLLETNAQIAAMPLLQETVELDEESGGLVVSLEQAPIITFAQWAINQAQSTNVLTALNNLISTRLASLSPGERRYQASGRRYRARAFVRVQRKVDCPPQIVWSDYSEPFVIAAWYESGADLPPVQVALPDPTDREALKALKPNVAFQVPKGLKDFLEANGLDDFLPDGEPSKGAGLALDWICGFNIPIITLCAFIVLYIFLSLFDLVFRWMMFIMVCIPVPKKSS